MAYLNDKNAKTIVDWSSARNNTDRLRHRPHVVNTANNRYDTKVRYYSSIDADLYFGDVFIDEITNITWQVQQNAMPIFGYNSYTFDTIATGSRIIQGQFAVNFTKANYLAEVMETMTTISRVTYGIDNPATCKTFTDADNVRRRTPKWDAGFDIVIGYGELKSNNEYETYLILDCCQITGCAQSLDYNGEPVQEIYSFTARDIKYTTINVNGNTESEGTSIEEIVENDSNSVLSLSGPILNFDGDMGHLKIDYSLKDTFSMTNALITFPDIPNLRTGILLSINTGVISNVFTGADKDIILKHLNDHNMTRLKADFTVDIYPETNSTKKTSYTETIIFTVTK